MSTSPTSYQLFSIIKTINQFFFYHLISLIVIVLIITAILINKIGTNKNMQIANKLKDSIDKNMKQFFINYQGQLVNQSPNIVKLYASGRDTCVFAILAFALIPRQQILSFLFNFLFIRLRDQLVIQIPIRTQSSLPLTMAIVRKTNIRQITKKKYPDIKTLCKQYKPSKQTSLNVPSTHSILVERKQHVQLLLATQKQIETWLLYSKYVKMMYLSDINRYSRYPTALRIVINITEEDLATQAQGINSIIQWTISFVDRISKYKMPPIDKKQAKKNRDGIKIDSDQI